MADDIVPDPDPKPDPPAKPAKVDPPAKPDAVGPDPAAEPALTTADLNKAIKDLLKDHSGDPNAALRTVLAERDKYRDEVAATAAKLPKEGAVVLDDDAKSLWETYQALGEPSELTEALKAGKAAGDELAAMRHKEFVSEVAGHVKWKPSVLADRITATKVEITIKDVPDPKDPKKQAVLKVPHVKLDGDKTAPLVDYAAAHWGDYLPALKLEPAKPLLPERGSPTSNGEGPPRPKIEPKAAMRQSVNALS